MDVNESNENKEVDTDKNFDYKNLDEKNPANDANDPNDKKADFYLG
jgi:hypothetical protein